MNRIGFTDLLQRRLTPLGMERGGGGERKPQLLFSDESLAQVDDLGLGLSGRIPYGLIAY